MDSKRPERRAIRALRLWVKIRAGAADLRKCVRTITLDPLTELLYWHMNRHLEHKMYAAVPCYNPRRLHRTVAEDLPAPRTLRGTWREMREFRRRRQTEPDYPFDTPVPASRPDSAAGADLLSASMGGLAARAGRGRVGVRIASAASPTTSGPSLRPGACPRARHPDGRRIRVRGQSSGRARGADGGHRALRVGEGKLSLRRRACHR